MSLTLSPSPTETGAAVSSAYAAYTPACGAPVAQALQDGLVAYDQFTDTSLTNTSNLDFQEFVNNYPD